MIIISPGRNPPKLASLYHKINQESTINGNTDSFEKVFVSSDKDESSFESHFYTMPWLALPFLDPTIKKYHQVFPLSKHSKLGNTESGWENRDKTRSEPRQPVSRKCISFHPSQNKIARDEKQRRCRKFSGTEVPFEAWP